MKKCSDIIDKREIPIRSLHEDSSSTSHGPETALGSGDIECVTPAPPEGVPSQGAGPTVDRGIGAGRGASE